MSEEVTDLQSRKIRIAIQKLSPQPNDIFTIQLPPDINHDQTAEFAARLQTQLPDGVSLLILRQDTKVDVIPEATLNELGYFRNVN